MCGSVNSTYHARKSQTFWLKKLKKKKKKATETCIWEMQNALLKRTLIEISFHMRNLLIKFIKIETEVILL